MLFNKNDGFVKSRKTVFLVIPAPPDASACIAPPSEPDWRISRIRLSGWWFYLREDWSKVAWESARLKNPWSRKN